MPIIQGITATNSLDCRKEDSILQSHKITALYERLSVDDKGKPIEQSSESIENQRDLLEDYASTNGFQNIVHYTDDGLSGRWFDRPAYLQMMEEVEAGKVEVIICKDLSRFGRSSYVGPYIEELRKKGVRFIALGENVDSLYPETLEFLGLYSFINEHYAKDCSKKIRAVFQRKGKSGKPTSSYPPFGYLKHPENKYLWVVDEEAAAVVRRIFQLTMEGKGPYQICCILKDDRVEIPAYYLSKKGAGLHQRYTFPDPYNWHSTTVCGILKKKEYLGHTVNFKTRKHFNDKKSHYVDESQWTVFENTHEPIIDQATFDNVQRIRGGIKRRPDGWGYTHPLSGILFCADCGGKLYCHRIYNGKDKPTYVCGNYAKSYDKISLGTKCKTGHRIDASTVMELVRDTLKQISDFAKRDKSAFIKSVQETLAAQQTDEVKKQKKRLAVCKKRFADLETLFKKIYEDNALGKLPDSRFQSLANDYNEEQTVLEKEIAELQSAVSRYEDGSGRAKRFIELVNRHTDFTELTIPMLNEFVNKILVHERDKKGKIDATQKVEIHFNFIGEYLPFMPEEETPLTPEQEEEYQKVLERRERFRQIYLERKANGKQKEYDQRYAEKVKARKAAVKAKLFEEGVVLGAKALAPVPLPMEQ